MKRKITESQYAELSDAIKELYKSEGDAYILDLEDDDTGALKRAKDREAAQRKEAEQRNQELKAQIEELTAKLEDGSNADARKRGDIETLEKSWQDKQAKIEKEYQDKLNGVTSKYSETLLESEAKAIAAKVFGDNATLGVRFVRDRLAPDVESGTVKVLDEKGQISSLTSEELITEFRTTETYAPLVQSGKGSGSGAPGNKNSGSVLKKQSDYNATERVLLKKNNPELYKQIFPDG